MTSKPLLFLSQQEIKCVVIVLRALHILWPRYDFTSVCDVVAPSTVTAIYGNVHYWQLNLHMMVMSAVFTKQHVKKVLSIRLSEYIFLNYTFTTYQILLKIWSSNSFKWWSMRNFTLKCPPEMLLRNHWGHIINVTSCLR